jgi:hypothetical protein
VLEGHHPFGFDMTAARKLLRLLGVKQLEFLGQSATGMLNRVDCEIRRKKAGSQVVADITSFDGAEKLRPYVWEDHPPWSDIGVEPSRIPGMVSEEERQYYSYIGRFYSGKGMAIELGPWLGRSTASIVNGLIRNPRFDGKKLHVYDDFVWRARWMNDHLSKTEQLQDHQDFQFLFEKYTESIHRHLIVEKRKIISHDGNEDLPQLSWDKGPIEIMYIDCGRSFEANQAWYNIFASSFLSGVTLLILQDWQTHSEIPVKWYNQIKQFVDSKDSKLQQVHELRNGSIATFLYR